MTKTNLPQYKKEHTEVIRRFRDFAWLWQRLQDTNRGVLSSYISFALCHALQLLLRTVHYGLAMPFLHLQAS